MNMATNASDYLQSTLDNLNGVPDKAHQPLSFNFKSTALDRKRLFFVVFWLAGSSNGPIHITLRLGCVQPHLQDGIQVKKMRT